MSNKPSVLFSCVEDFGLVKCRLPHANHTLTTGACLSLERMASGPVEKTGCG